MSWAKITYHDNVAVEVLSDVDVALHDGVESGDVDTAALKTKDRRLEQSLRSTESLVADGDDLTVGKLVGLLQAGALGSGLDLLLEVEGDVAELLLDITNDFSLGGGGESVTTLSQDLHQVVGKITTSHVNTSNGVRQSETLVDGDNVGNTITGVENDTGGTTGSVQGQNGLDRDVEGGSVEGLEDDLGHLLTVGLGVDGGLGEQDGVLLGGNTQLIVEGVVPDLLHVVPVGDNTVLDGVSQGQDTTLRLSLITDVGVLLTHTNHDTRGDSVRSMLPRIATTKNDGGRHVSVDYCNLPMVTGSTDNGGYLTALAKCQAKRAVAARKRPIAPKRIALAGSCVGKGAEVGYSRKTARGASSPAKPALHIPELHCCQLFRFKRSEITAV